MMPVKRGDIYWVNFDPRRGSEQGGVRPALVVQNDVGNEHSPTTVVVAISSAPLQRPYPFVVPLDPGEGGLNRASHVNCAHILTVSQERLGKRIGVLDAQRMEEVTAALHYELGPSRTL